MAIDKEKAIDDGRIVSVLSSAIPPSDDAVAPSAMVSAKKQSLSDIFTIVSYYHFGSKSGNAILQC